MPPVKRIMLQSRLQKRLKELKMTSFKEYCNYIFSKEGLNNEIIHMLDVVSTNKTDFFREPVHFDFLTSNILPELVNTSKTFKSLKIWSAGCSSGEEPYTIAIVLFEYLEKNPGFDFSILGTDISTKILQKAIDAVYKEERVEGIPLELKRKYFLKSKDRENPSVKMGAMLRSKVHFDRLNFMDSSYNVRDMFDIVFCRNVLIYFDRETQEKVINKICTKIPTGGYFFLGHSESIMNMNLPLRQIKPTIYQKI
jgi:chemotaxis protein methyltransferase CheR